MGQKVHPTGIRLGITESWRSNWFSESKGFADKLAEDIQVRQFIFKKLKHASVSEVRIDRPAQNANVTIYTARPGIVIGKKGEDIDRLRTQVSQLLNVPVQINIEEIKKPELDAQLVANTIADQLEKRVMFRRAMKRAVQGTMRMGAKGIKVNLSGRLGGAEIARTEWYKEGRIPLHTFRADIDYALAEANTAYGIIGVKVWIFKGEVLPGQKRQPNTTPKRNKKSKKRT